MELLEHAKELHRSCFVADSHYDLLNLVAEKRIEKGRKNVIASDYLKKFRAGGVNLLICSIFIDNHHLPEMGLRRALDQISCLHEEIDECDELVICRNTEEIRKAYSDGRIALLLSFEGVDPLGSDLKLLRVFYELGVRGMGLVWSRRNYAADGAFFHPVPEGKKGGLTDWGVRLVSLAEELGMYIDVSHLNDEGFRDLCSLSQRPFMASHSNCRSLTPVMRNLTDEQIAELGRRGGVMGMNACASFVRLEKDGPATPHELAAHGLHTAAVAGAEHLTFGFDFCDEFRLAHGEKPGDAVNFYDSAYTLTAELLAQGMSECDVRKVLGENTLAFLERTIG